MKREIFNLVKKEFMYIALLLLLVLIMFKIIFFKENLIVLLRNALSLFWLFALPGYFIMLYWKDKLEFMERFLIGVALAAGAIGIFSYYLGLIGVHIRYHAVLLPLLLILVGITANLRK